MKRSEGSAPADRFLDHSDRSSDRVASGRARVADWKYNLDNGLGSHPALAGILGGIVVISALLLIGRIRDTPISQDAPVDTRRSAIASIEGAMRRGFSPKSNDVPGYDVHLSEGGGYLFSYPDTWEITSVGDKARLISPDEEVVMTFGTSLSGPLESASDRVFEGATSSYEDVELVASEIERTPQGFRSVVAGGDALDAAGARIRFLVITIEGPNQNRAVTVRFSPSADPLESLSSIQDIISSFRISPSQ